MKYLRVEYLVSIKKQGSLFANIDAFNNFLRSDSNILIENQTIKYRKIIVAYEVQKSELKDQRFFNLKFIYDWGNQTYESLNDYSQLLKSIRTLLFNLPIQCNCIWDDIALYYSTKAYPLIYEIENLMRKLITKFMITNVGINWEDEALPKEIKSVISNSRNRQRKEVNNFLYEIDFIHLSDFLFKPYYNQTIDELYNKIKKAKTTQDLNIDELKSFIPKSNWQKYFSDLVNYEDSKLQKKWEELYQLRCKVAHNNKITKDEFEKIENIVFELREKLQEAVNKLDQLEITEEEKETIVENVSISNKAMKARVIKAIKAGATEALGSINYPAMNIALAVLEGWQSAE